MIENILNLAKKYLENLYFCSLRRTVSENVEDYPDPNLSMVLMPE
jgi:hypothetical protein